MFKNTFLNILSESFKKYTLVIFNSINEIYQCKLKLLNTKKAFQLRKAFPNISGLDGTRTRDPMRDRHVF